MARQAKQTRKIEEVEEGGEEKKKNSEKENPTAEKKMVSVGPENVRRKSKHKAMAKTLP